MYKSEYINRNEKYVIDEINKCYSYSDKNGYYGSNNALTKMCSKINSNIIYIPYVRYYNLKILFNPNYATKIEGVQKQRGQMAIQKGKNITASNDVFCLSIEDDGKYIYYLENHFDKQDRSKIDSAGYFYSDIGTALNPYLEIPDLTEYTLINEY